MKCRYYYDHQRRLVGRRDNHGNVTQFFYSNPDSPYQVTHIFSPRDLRLTTLTYDDAGHLMFVQILRNRFYVATDQCGTPTVIFSQHGELVRELVRSPYGHVVYDSNPYLYMPIDWRGGIADPVTGQVHVQGDRIYDPLIGQWLNPEWKRATQAQYQPELMHLYRLPRNDPINMNMLQLTQTSTYNQWLEKMGYNLPFVSSKVKPPMTLSQMPAKVTSNSVEIVKDPMVVTNSLWVKLSKKLNSLLDFAEFSSKCTPPKESSIPDFHYSLTPSVLGRGILLSRSSDGRTIVSATSLADPITRDVFTNVLNNSRWLNLTLPSHGQDTFHFFKRDVRKISEDMSTLRRLGPNINLTMHESDTGSKEVKISTGQGTLVLVYGADIKTETEQLWKHAFKLATRRAWHREQILARRGGINTFPFSSSEVDQLSREVHLPIYRPELQQSLWNYPLLADDPTTVRFRKRSGAQSVEPPR